MSAQQALILTDKQYERLNEIGWNRSFIIEHDEQVSDQDIQLFLQVHYLKLIENWSGDDPTGDELRITRQGEDALSEHKRNERAAELEKPAPLNKPTAPPMGRGDGLHGEQIHRAHIVSVRAETISGAVTYYLETEGKGPLQISARFQRKAFDSLPDAVKALVPPADMKVDFDVAWKWVEITKRGGGKGKVREVLNVFVPDTTGMDRASIRSKLLGERGINPGSKTSQVHGYLDSHVTPDTDLEEYARFVNDAIDEVKGKPERKYSPAKWERWIRGKMADKCRAKDINNDTNINDLIKDTLEVAAADGKMDDDQFILNLLGEEIRAFNEVAEEVTAQRKGNMQAPATTIDAPAGAPDTKPAAFEIDVETWKRIDKLCARYKVAAAGREERITGWLGKDWNGSPDDTYRKVYLTAIDEYGILQRKPFVDDVVQMFKAAGLEVNTREAIKRVNVEAALDIEPRMLPSEVVTGVSAWIKAQQKMAEDARAEEAARAKEQSAPKASQEPPATPPAATTPVTPAAPASAPVVSVESAIVETTAEAEFVEPSTIVQSTGEIILFDPNRAMQQVKGNSDLVTGMMRNNILTKSKKEKGEDGKEIEVDGDYGIIAGSKKPALFKSGAEKLCAAFGLRPEFELMADSISNWDAPFFYFHYRCKLYRISTGELVATANGSCNSKEDKYGWRWVEADRVPARLRRNIDELETRGGRISEPDFAIEKAETSGRYGKPAEYWKQFQDAIAKGTAVKVERKKKDGGNMLAWEIDAALYRIPNPDVFSIVNTLDKMSQKRALIGAVLIGTAASLFFNQDIEDLPDFGMVA